MKEYFQNLQKIFGELNKTSENNKENNNILEIDVARIRNQISKLNIYCEKNEIKSSFLLSIIFTKEIRNDIEKIISFNSDTSLNSYLSQDDIPDRLKQCYKEISKILADEERLKNIILTNGIFEKLKIRNKEVIILESQLERVVQNLTGLIKQLNSK